MTEQTPPNPDDPKYQEMIAELQTQEKLLQEINEILNDPDYQQTANYLGQALQQFCGMYVSQVAQLSPEQLHNLLATNIGSCIKTLKSLGWEHNSKKTGGLIVPPGAAI